MATIAFNVTNASVSSRIETTGLSWSLTLMLMLPRVGEYLTLATGEDVRTARIALTIKVESQEYAEWLQAQHGTPDKAIIGIMHYFDDPAILSDLTISQEAHDRLISFATTGRFPSEVRLDVQNITYDWRPDGSGKVWDNRAHPAVGVTDVRFDIPLSKEVSELSASQAASPITAAEPDLTRLVRQTVMLQQWILGALIVGAAAVVFGR